MRLEWHWVSDTRLNTVYDVARAAGVSVATVSRVLNGYAKVSPKTRERVLALISKSGFRPNVNARRLVQGRSGQICFLLSNRHVVHSFHSRILMGVEDNCRSRNQHVVFTTLNYGPDESFPSGVIPRIISEDGSIDGLLIAGTNYPVLLRHLDSVRIPYVMFGNNLVTGSLALPRKKAVSFDEDKGGEHAASFLIQLGHRHLTFVGDLSKPWYQRRFEGFKRAMIAAGLPAACADLREHSDYFELGKRALPIVLREHPKTTAIVAQDDETACGVMDSLRRLGMRAPDDISIIGYDDITEIQYLHPALTTMRVPKEKIGWAMADELFRVIAGEHSRSVSPLITTELVIRDSCARAPEAAKVVPHDI
jgi:DNA-binding LacI/PurR family transcriptional regulator